MVLTPIEMTLDEAVTIIVDRVHELMVKVDNKTETDDDLRELLDIRKSITKILEAQAKHGN